MSYDVTTLGEGQLRLTAPAGVRLMDARHLAVCAAGSEANVAGLLAQLGRRTCWASLVPAGDLGERVLAEYRSAGVDLAHVGRPPVGRVATYYLEPGATGVPARVTYDRLGTPFRDADIGDFDWDAMLDTRLLFVSGITLALTNATAAIATHAIDAAAARGVPVALDVNHRTTLWTADDAAARLGPLLARVTLLFCSRRDASTVFGIEGTGSDAAARLRELSSANHVVTTDGGSAVYYAGTDGEFSVQVDPVAVVDRPGAGDALVGGTLHGWMDGDVEAGLGYGIRAAAIALTHHGDLTRLSARDIDVEANGDIHR